MAKWDGAITRNGIFAAISLLSLVHNEESEKIIVTIRYL